MLAILTAVMAPAALFGVFVLAGAAFAKSLQPRVGADGAVMMGLAWLGAAGLVTFWTSFIDLRLGSVVGVLGVIVSLGAIVWSRAWRRWRAIVPVGLVAVGSTLATVGLFRLWMAPVGLFEFSRTRTVAWMLPVDNVLPSALADWLAGDRPQFLSGDWLPSDRPPLQTGLLLLARGVLGPLAGISRGFAGEELAYGTSVAAQSLGVVSIVALMWALGYTTRIAVATVAFVAALPTTYINMVYTWPKLLAAAFIVGAIAVLVAAVRRAESQVTSVILAAVLSLLAIASHGGAVFVLPAVLTLAVIVFARCNWAERGRMTAGAIAAFALIYAPWIAFQRIVAPPGDRLLKWHLAGVVEVDDRSFLRALVDQYAASSWMELLQVRASNLATALWPQSLEGADVWRDGWQDRAQHAAFFNTAAAIGLGAALVGGVLVTALISRIRHRRDDRLHDAAGLSLLMLACIVLWSLVLFQPEAAIVHQGSQAWLMILSAVAFGWVAFTRWRLATWIILPAQALWTIVVFADSAFYADAPMSPAAVSTLCVGVAVVATAIITSPGRSVRSAAARSGRPIGYTRST
ncbi:hypothetical protein [Microbacterium hibisci]|uniref:hypothetical protein n=1 Tax=Microbacterium hibisci TaxID=2036000 RepID=UPI0019416AEF|nr:hypothetical protein [Microbacterium hibisci]